MARFLTKEPKEVIDADAFEDFKNKYLKNSVLLPCGKIVPRHYLNVFAKPAEDYKEICLQTQESSKSEMSPSPANSHNLFDDEPRTPLTILVEKVTQPLSPVIKQSPMIIDLSTPSPSPAYTYIFDDDQMVTQPQSPVETDTIDLVTPPPSPKKWLNKHRQSIKMAQSNSKKKYTEAFTSLSLQMNRELARSKKYYKLWVQERKLRDKAEARLSEFTANYFNKY